MKKWTVKSKGRLQKIAIFYSVLLLIVVIFFVANRPRSGRILSEMNAEDTVFFLLVTSPLWATVLLVTLNRLLKSKVPLAIIIDDHAGIFALHYSKKKKDVIPLTALAYSHSPRGPGHLSITFYKTFTGSRGQTVYNEVVQIIGMKRSRSWKVDQLTEVISHLEALAVEKTRSVNERMSFFDKIISG